MYEDLYYLLGIAGFQLFMASVVYFIDMRTRSFFSLTFKRIVFKIGIVVLSFGIPIGLWVYIAVTSPLVTANGVLFNSAYSPWTYTYALAMLHPPISVIMGIVRAKNGTR